jgi:hypothetical protein
MKNEFERENRYIVLKRKHLVNLPSSLQHRLKPALDEAAQLMPKFECVIIESDWPEYEPAWQMIERRVMGASTHVGVIVAKNWLVGAPRVATLYGGDSLPDGALLYLAPPATPGLAEVTLQILKEARDIPDGLYARAKHLAAAKTAMCKWSYDELGFSWRTQCGTSWAFTDGGTPDENGMNFCHSCGNRLTFDAPEEAEE